ncbi:hypothetical protein D9M71_470760 [compost metagenome]
MNLEIKKLHQQLIETHQSLAKRLGNTSDPDEAEDILREMEELNFRLMMSGRLLFKRTTATIDRRIGTVIEASTDLDEAIKHIAQVKELVKAVGKFLTLVDRALDVIKLL